MRDLSVPEIWKDEFTLAALDINQREGSCVGKRKLAPMVEQNSNNDAILALYCGCLLWTGERDRAFQVLTERLKQRESASVLATLALAQRMEGDDDKATETISIAQSVDPYDYLYLRHGSDLALVRGDTEAWEELVSAAEALYPDDIWVYAKRITAAYVKGDCKEARRILESAPDRFKSSASYHYNSGMIFLKDRDLEHAAEQFQFAVAMEPESPQYWANLCMVHRHCGRFEQAEQAANFALELDPTNRMALENQKKLAERKGDNAKVKYWEERLSSAIPTLGNPRAQEATQCVRDGNYKKAIGLHKANLDDPKVSLVYKLGSQKTLLSLFSQHEMWTDTRELINRLSPEMTASDVEIQIYRAELEYFEGDHGAVDRLEALVISNQAVGYGHPVLTRIYLKSKQRDRLVSLIDHLCQHLTWQIGVAVTIIIALDQAGERELAEKLYQSVSKKNSRIPALKYYELGRAMQQGDFPGAKQINQELPPGERITVKSVIKSKIKKFFG